MNYSKKKTSRLSRKSGKNGIAPGLTYYKIDLKKASQAFGIDAKKRDPKISINATADNIYAAAQRDPKVARYLLKNYLK